MMLVILGVLGCLGEGSATPARSTSMSPSEPNSCLTLRGGMYSSSESSEVSEDSLSDSMSYLRF